MSELTISNLIKIILGVLVFVVVVAGLYLVFKDKVIEFFKGLPTGGSSEMFLSLLKGEAF